MEQRDQILTRLYVTLTLVSLIPVLVVFQLLRIHLLEGPVLREQGKQQASSYMEIPAIRGPVLDRAGRVLVVDAARYELALDPTAPGFTQEIERSFFDKLSRLTGQPASSFRRMLRSSSSPQYVRLMRDLSEEQKEKVEQWGVPGLILTPEFARRYNYGKTAAHVLGHVDADGKGIAGLELQLDEYLIGTPGRRSLKRDRLGIRKALVGGRVVEPEHGETVVLTLDLIRQTIVEEELARGVEEMGARWGTAIAMDPYTGAILALANVPTYDPNRPGAFNTEARRNRAITDRYEPGSTFKLVTAVAAVDQGIVSLEDTVDTGPGWASFGGRPLRDTHAHGKISFADVIAQSSNVGAAHVGSRVDRGVFYQYARNLGFGQPTWIDLPGEVGGYLKKPSSWSRTTHSRMSIGYEVDVTPLQILTAYGALANGGVLVHPYIVAERRDVTGQTIWTATTDSVRRAFKRETARKLIPAFERAITDGTAKRAAIEGLPVAGKTGTALKATGGSYQAGAYRASFAGFFPADDPVAVLVIVLDEPAASGYGGTAAAPIFQRIVQRWLGTFPKVAERIAPTGTLPESSPAPLPDVRGLPLNVAVAKLTSSGYDVEVPDHAEGTVTEQRANSESGDRVSNAIRLVADGPDSLRVLPDLTGLSARQATYWLTSRGVDVRIEGTGRVVSQSPAPGAPVPAEVTVRCR